MTPRGIRNNNPGNLKDFGIPWDGLVGRDADGFCVFATPFHGIRAAARDAHTDWSKGQTTVRTLLGGLRDSDGKLLRGGWAPEDENDTENYISFVCKATGWREDEKLDFSSAATLGWFLRQVFKMECGVTPYSDELIGTAVVAALEGR